MDWPSQANLFENKVVILRVFEICFQNLQISSQIYLKIIIHD